MSQKVISESDESKSQESKESFKFKLYKITHVNKEIM